MTVNEALREASASLSAVSDTARMDAELLMAHALGVSRSTMLLHKTNEPAPSRFEAFVARRQSQEPIAFITGVQEFFGRPFKVTRDTLIPRPDSETVVQVALDALEDSTKEAPKILDLGTGTGALLLSILAERPDCVGFGLDSSAAALAVAKENAAQLGLTDRATLAHGSWHDEKRRWLLGWPDAFDLIVANPPYVETSASLDRQVRDFEPHAALFAGPEGLDDYRVIIPTLGKILTDGGTAVLEIGATQAQAVSQMAEKEGFVIEVRYDLANRPRALILSDGIRL